MKSEETIDFHIRWAWYNISRMYNLKAGEFGGSMAIGYALLNIDRDGTPSTKLAPKMGMEPRSLTRMIKNLDQNGLIQKVSDKSDKRLVKIFLTDKGKVAGTVANIHSYEWAMQTGARFFLSGTLDWINKGFKDFNSMVENL